MASSRRGRPVFARFYAWASPRLDRAGTAQHRARLLAGLTGAVIEVGAGNGLNFAHYPREVTRVLAVEPEARLRDLAHRAAAAAPIPVDVVDGLAEHLPATSASFDAAVACLMLCSVPSQPAALAEMHRVLRPGGQLRFFEHVQASSASMRRLQRVLDATVWPPLCGGCHTGRDTAAAIENAGFAIRTVNRFSYPEAQVRGPAATHILGTAIAGPRGHCT
jgi:ubiquinone/menaquinone biosynthesis C-methylase UbiE